MVMIYEVLNFDMYQLIAIIIINDINVFFTLKINQEAIFLSYFTFSILQMCFDSMFHFLKGKDLVTYHSNFTPSKITKLKHTFVSSKLVVILALLYYYSIIIIIF